MSVIVFFSNQDNAVGIADSRNTFTLCHGQRYSDSVKKLHKLSAKNYEAIISGTGDAETVQKYFRIAKNMHTPPPAGTLEQLAHDLYNTIMEDYAEEKKDYIQEQIKNIKIDAKATIGKKERDEYVQSAIKHLREIQIPEYEQEKRATNFILGGYDKIKKSIIKFYIEPFGFMELFTPYQIIGSGLDAGNMAELKETNGIPIEKLSLEELAFLTSKVFVNTTLNVGVGGAPEIALINQDGVKILEKQKSIALANVMAAYQAEKIPRDFAERYANTIIRGNANYKEIAYVLDLTPQALKTLVTPLSSWIESENIRRYSNR